jgi:hypothetical protein
MQFEHHRQCLAIGLDNTQPNILRVVDLWAEKVLEPWPGTQHQKIKSLPEFQTYWADRHVDNYAGFALAATSVQTDPFGCLAWLAEQGRTVKRFHDFELPNVRYFEPQEDELFGFLLPRPYLRAFGLAIIAAYEAVGSRALEGLWGETAHLQDRMRQLERSLRRASAIIPF